MNKHTVAIIGLGQFGRFMAAHLEPYCTVVPVDRDTPADVVSTCDIVVFAVPWGSMVEAVDRVRPHVARDALIVDVTSVKQLPLALLTERFAGYDIIGTHPIFGPQSGKDGITGLPIVVCRESCDQERYDQVVQFLSGTLALRVIEQTPQQHDHDMAEVQGLTHFIGRAIAQMQIKSHATNTKSYEQLLELKRLVGDDSFELFKTIQHTNPQAAVVRRRFMAELSALERELSS